jgi:hypothetical protein
MLSTEVLLELGALGRTEKSSPSPDWWARGISLTSAMIALTSLAFAVGKEWWRGRRVRVAVMECPVEGTAAYVVEVTNSGGLPLQVTDWGYVFTAGRAPGRDRRWLMPDGTGINGPQLPKTIPSGERLLLNTPTNRVEAIALEGSPKKHMRAFALIASASRPRYSKSIWLP